MTKNESNIDRGIRIVAGLALLSLTFIGPQTWYGLVGIIPLATGLTGFCPLYRMMGISSCAVPKSES